MNSCGWEVRAKRESLKSVKHEIRDWEKEDSNKYNSIPSSTLIGIKFQHK
jgi:hypothetical protein